MGGVGNGDVDQHREAQVLQCSARGGTWRLSFRQAITREMSPYITADDLRGELERLDTIERVKVEYISVRLFKLQPSATREELGQIWLICSR